jgi:hypothetical protein
MGKKIFAFTHQGSGRFTGQTCDAEHRYEDTPGGLGFWVGPNCCHLETEGRVVEEEEFAKEYVWDLHDFFHTPSRSEQWCPHCRQAGWV